MSISETDHRVRTPRTFWFSLGGVAAAVIGVAVVFALRPPAEQKALATATPTQVNDRVSRRGEIESAGVAVTINIGMNRILPVVIMIGGCSVPAAIVRLERGMVPLHARVGIGIDCILPGIAQCPDAWHIDPGEIPFN